MRILFIVAISFACLPASLAAMDFGPADEADSLSVTVTADEESSMAGDLESSDEPEEEQPEIRVTRKSAVGLRLGEVTPHASSGLVWQRTLNNQSSITAAISKGDFRTAEQNEGEAWFENRAKSLSASGRYLWWPSPSFPFALSGGLSIESASGTVTSKTGTRGEYRTETAYVSSSLVMSHIFLSGLWVEWTLISFNYGKNFKGTYESTTASQMVRIRNNLNGLKILGFANLTLGYAW